MEIEGADEDRGQRVPGMLQDGVPPTQDGLQYCVEGIVVLGSMISTCLSMQHSGVSWEDVFGS